MILMGETAQPACLKGPGSRHLQVGLSKDLLCLQFNQAFCQSGPLFYQLAFILCDMIRKIANYRQNARCKFEPILIK